MIARAHPPAVESSLWPLGARLVDACRIGPGDRVLDVAAGIGHASTPAARRGAQVFACDHRLELLDAGRLGLGAEALDIAWLVAEPERLPFESGMFDVVMSSAAPHHQAAADELLRLCRPGGTIGLLSRTRHPIELFGDRVRFEQDHLILFGRRA